MSADALHSLSSALVLGLGSSGEAAARLLRARGVSVTVLDAGSGPALDVKARILREAGCAVRVGPGGLPGSPVDVAVLSPGIPVTDPWVVALRARGIPVISELELGWRFRRSRILAVTGSNGKSTLVKLCHEAIQRNGLSAVVGGNYGTPLSTLVRMEPAPDWIVVEVSSFQLETVEHFSPDAGILLNLNPNHLDRHGTMEEYTAMKARLFARMGAGQTAVIPADAPEAVRRAIPADVRVVTFGTTDDASYRYVPGQVVGPGVESPVTGTVFDNEIMGVTAAACTAALLGAGLPSAGVEEAARGFERLPHRMQTTAVLKGVTFINDSKATNLAALSAGLRMAPGPTWLIAGGLLKEKDLDSVKKVLANRVRGVYIIGRYSGVMAAAWRSVVPCVVCTDLREAVFRAWSEAVGGEVVLLSPGCASFDQFKSFEDRGEQFSGIVKEIEKEIRL